MTCSCSFRSQADARFPLFSNATQRNTTHYEFLRNKTKVLRTLLRNRRRLNGACGWLLAGLLKQIETTSIFPQRRRRTGQIRDAFTFNLWL